MQTESGKHHSAGRYGYPELLIGSALLWAFCVTLLRGLRRPNDWAEAHWLLSYDFGPLKRALPGTLVKPLLSSEGGEAVILLVSTGILGLFCAMLVWMSFRVLHRSRWRMDSVLVLLVFLSSQYVVMSGHLNGYFDSLLMILTFTGVLLVLNGAPWTAAAVLSAGVLVHEIVILVGVPSVAFAALLRRVPATDDSPGAGRLSISSVRFLVPFLLPYVTFVLLAVCQSLLLDVATLRGALTEHLAGFAFIQGDRHLIAPKDLTTSFNTYLVDQAPRFLGRIFGLEHIVRIGPSLAALLAAAWMLAKERYLSKYLIAAVVLISLLPLSLHIIAWDTSRIWTYPLVVAMLAVWALHEVGPAASVEGGGSPLFRIGCAGIVLANILTPPSLMDGAVDRFSTAVRLSLFVPVAVLLALGLSMARRARRGIAAA